MTRASIPVAMALKLATRARDLLARGMAAQDVARELGLRVALEDEYVEPTGECPDGPAVVLPLACVGDPETPDDAREYPGCSRGSAIEAYRAEQPADTVPRHEDVCAWRLGMVVGPDGPVEVAVDPVWITLFFPAAGSRPGHGRSHRACPSSGSMEEAP